MESQTKTYSTNRVRACQNCKLDFTIEPEDFNFYEKIKVPPPTWCPECRMIRRMSWRNVRSLYKRECDLCKKSIITMYDESMTSPIYCRSCFYGDGWNPMDYGTDIDWTKPFLTQWKELWDKIPKYSLLSWKNSQNSDYANIVINSKDCYLSYSIVESEKILYSENIDNSQELVDCYMCIEGCDSCYYTQGRGNYGGKYLSQCVNCVNVNFCFDCNNCQDCFMSYNLRNKKYVFRGVQLGAEEYKEALEKENLASRMSLDKLYTEWVSMIEEKAIHQYARIILGKDSTGNFLKGVKNIKHCFNTYDSENLAYGARGIKSKDAYDFYGLVGELTYETVGCSFGAYGNLFSFNCDANRSIEYTSLSSNSSDLYGCVSLQKKQHCILNKQYSKDEYFSLVDKIRKHMDEMPYIDEKGRVYKYGEFFPFEFSPFGYNETFCLDFFPTTEVEAKNMGYKWRTQKERNHLVDIKTQDVPDKISIVDEAILNKVIECKHYASGSLSCNHQCTEAFRITYDELLFYKKWNIPLPRLCPNCRHYERLPVFMQPMKLWHRKCMKNGCTNEFETSYSPDRPEIVYCETCYNAEVY
ncbi:MAG: hypothetical protein QG644_267 [Patescibacteria group bacterium]|nr:hypothetical protein [Patescibacteria group bacterium]